MCIINVKCVTDRAENYLLTTGYLQLQKGATSFSSSSKRMKRGKIKLDFTYTDSIKGDVPCSAFFLFSRFPVPVYCCHEKPTINIHTLIFHAYFPTVISMLIATRRSVVFSAFSWQQFARKEKKKLGIPSNITRYRVYGCIWNERLRLSSTHQQSCCQTPAYQKTRRLR